MSPETVAVNVFVRPVRNVSVKVDPFTRPLKGDDSGGPSTNVHTPFGSRRSFLPPKTVSAPEIVSPVCTSVIVRSPLYVTCGGFPHGVKVVVYLPMYVPVSAESGGCELVSDSVKMPDVTVCANDKLIDVALTAPVSGIDEPLPGAGNVPLNVPPEIVPVTGNVIV